MSSHVQLLKRFGDGARVDLVDALPSPFGLVRSGVAPDHPETKNVLHQFTNLARTDPRIRFFGNVRLGKDVSLDKLRQAYHAVVLAYGAESDRSLSVPGEDTPGVLSAREFVWWYNGHPSVTGLPVDLRSVHSVAIVGLGNVALDCARILLQDPERLGRTDVTARALDMLRGSAVRDVHIVGRRGPVQASFTPKELRELVLLPGIRAAVDPQDLLDLTPGCQAELAGSRIKRRVMEVLTKATATQKQGDRTVHFHFLSAPKAVIRDGEGSVAGLELEKQQLQARPGDAKSSPVGTGKMTTLPVQMVLKSIGYKSIPVEGLPFDERRGVVPNIKGQVVESTVHGANTVPGLFVAGWLGRGPTGIIGTNLIDAEQVVETMAQAAAGWTSPSLNGIEAVMSRTAAPLHWDGWERVDAAEITAGEPDGKPREKFVSVPDMLQAAA